MRLLMTVGTILTVFLLAGCAGAHTPAQQTTTKEGTMSMETVQGYTGGCKEGFTIRSQNQLKPYGTMVRRDLSKPGESAGLHGNDVLKADGWIKTEHVFYPDNPEGLRGEVWFHVMLPDGSWAWAPDAGVRAVETQHSPGDRDEDFDPVTQAAPQPSGCELFPL